MFKKIAFTIFLLLASLSVVFALRSDRDVTTSSEEAYKLFKEGQDLVYKLHTRQAMEKFEQAVELDSNFAMAWFYLSNAKMAFQYHAESEKAWEIALSKWELVSDREKLLLDLGRVAKSKGSDSLVIELANGYIKKYSDYVEGYIILASMEMKQNNFEAAIDIYKKVLEIDKNYINSHNMLGYLNYYLGRYDEALSHLQLYSEIAANEANPHDSRGEILHAIGKYQQAIDQFREAYNISPELDFPILHMAESYEALGMMSRVDYCFDLLLSREENKDRLRMYHMNWGHTFVRRGEIDTATVIFKKLIEEKPEDFESLNSLAWVYYKTRNLKGYESVLEKIYELAEKELTKDSLLKDSDDYKRKEKRVLAFLNDLQGNYDQAIELYQQVVDENSIPKYKIYARNHFADILIRANKLDQAKSELQKNLSTNPNTTKSLLLLAEIYDLEGDYESARSYNQRALEIWSNADEDFKPYLELKEKLSTDLVAKK